MGHQEAIDEALASSFREFINNSDLNWANDKNVGDFTQNVGNFVLILDVAQKSIRIHTIDEWASYYLTTKGYWVRWNNSMSDSRPHLFPSIEALNESISIFIAEPTKEEW